MIVVRHRPILVWSIRVVVFATSIIGVVAAYQYGYSLGADKQAALEQALAETQQSVPQLEIQVAELTQLLINAKMGAEVDRKATEEVRKELLELKSTLQVTKEENLFFRNIMSPGKDQTGPDIGDWARSKGDDANKYHFKVVAKQLAKHTNSVTGTVKVLIEGKQQGQKVSLDYADISTAEETQLKVKFRYFKTVEGTFVLPKDFQPEAVIVTLRIAGKKPKNITKHFVW